MSFIRIGTDRETRDAQRSDEHGLPDDLERAIVATVAYADIFDYPLTADEIHRYLVGISADIETVEQALSNTSLIPAHLDHAQGYFFLPGRESVIETRRRRAAIADRFWPRALLYGRVIASLPFVRMVAITGELAVDNADVRSDIDYFIVTEPGRLWLCRAMAVVLVRTARLRGDTICPNYILTEQVLELDNRTLYTAHELTQMVPLSGTDIYLRIRAMNEWSNEFLPNAAGPPRTVRCQPMAGRFTKLAEHVLRGSIGARLEKWEMERKIRKLAHASGERDEIAFSPDWCKGHFDGHGKKTLAEYADRLQRVEGLAP